MTNWLRGRQLANNLPLLAIVIVCVCWSTYDFWQRARGAAVFWAAMALGEIIAFVCHRHVRARQGLIWEDERRPVAKLEKT